MVASPVFGRIQQRLANPAGATMWRYRQILDPGSLPEPNRDNVEIDRREPDDCVVVISDQDSAPIIGHGGLEPINRDG